jgi:hypothetical protein
MTDMVQGFVGDLMILIHTARPPSGAEWAEYIRAVAAHDPAKLRTLVFTDGGAPNSPQRKEVNDVLGGRASRGAIVSASAIVRGAVMALSWFNPLIRAFPPTELEDALRYLSVPAEELPAVWEEVRRLRDVLGDPALKCVPKTV